MPASRGSSQVPALSGVKPRSANGSQNRASDAATVKSLARARWNPMPAAQPCTRHTTGTWTDSTSGTRRWASDGTRRWIDPTRGRGASGPPALRATMSAPPQKWSPAPASTIARTRSSRPAASMASISPATITSSSALRLSGRSSVSRRRAPSSAMRRPGTGA